MPRVPISSDAVCGETQAASLRRIAVPHLLLPDGRRLGRTIIYIHPADGRVVRHEPLRHEAPFTEWHDCDAALASDGTLHLNS